MNRKMFAFAARGLALAVVTLLLTSCGVRYYKFPENVFAGRPVPPSKFAHRVMVGYNGATSGVLQILDAERDLRNNIFDANSGYTISGFSGTTPSPMLSFPEQVTGFVYAQSSGSLTTVDYGKESTNGDAASIPAKVGVPDGIKISSDFNFVYGASDTAGYLSIINRSTSRTYVLNVPNVNRVFVNRGNTVVLAMQRNSDRIFRIVRLNTNQAVPPGAVDCQPYALPEYCVVPVSGSFDRPVGAVFSLDGSQAYILNCGPECGGTTASVSVLNVTPLTINNIPTVAPEPNYVTANIVVPGGVTAAIPNASTLYVSGQQQNSSGYWAGNLTTIDLATLAVTGRYSISDGNHSKMVFADDNTLWIGSQFCATGARKRQADLGDRTQAANYNCLTRFDLGTRVAAVLPAVNQNTGAALPYPNQDNNQFYYGDLTGLCWVQTMHKVYTAYGGQVHAFNTADGSEINNRNITVAGTVIDVASMDNLTNAAY